MRCANFCENNKAKTPKKQKKSKIGLGRNGLEVNIQLTIILFSDRTSICDKIFHQK